MMKALHKRIANVLLLTMTAGIVIPSPALFIHKVSAAPADAMPNGGFETVVSPGDAGWVGQVQPQGWGVWLASGSGKASVAKDAVHSGANAAKIDHAASARTGLSTNVPVTGGASYKLAAWVKTANVVSGGGVFVRTQYYAKVKGVGGSTADEKVGDGPLLAKLTGTNDWTLREALLAVPAGANFVRVEPFFETGTGIAWFDDLSLSVWNGVTSVSLEPSSASLSLGQTVTLTPKVSPDNASDKTVVWSSSNPAVATVVAGTVTAKGYGNAIITAATQDGLVSGKTSVQVESAEALAGYDTLKQRWTTKLTGGAGASGNDADVAAAVSALSSRVSNVQRTGRWDTLNKASNRTDLWADVITKTNTNSANITKAYGILLDMATAYATESSPLYRNAQLRDDIIGALAWMYDNQYNERKTISGNWWDWEIGAPQAVVSILALMSGDLDASAMTTYLKVLDTFVPDPTKRVQNASVIESGANLLDKALVVTLRGAVGRSSAKIEQGRTAIPGELKYAQNGDGIYTDGSLIQHTNVAYTGAYGSVLIGRIADLLYLLNPSPWTLTDSGVANVYKWVGDTFEPVIYKGAVMDMTRGRSISRSSDSDHLSGRGIIRTLARLTVGAPSDAAVKMKAMIKEWVRTDTTFPNYYDNMPAYEIALLKNIVADSSVTPRGELVKSQHFAAMDRSVHMRSGFGFAVSMFSDRISAFEYGNGENRKGWYTGIGMTNLYNSDLNQYSDAYWPTVNMARLPGTTTDGYLPAPKEWGAYYNPKAWVGGSVSEGLYGAAGMDFALSGSTGAKLQGKKSWFMFDDEIVALGSGIASTDDRKIETIVDNRQLLPSGANKLTVNGTVKPSALGWSETMSAVQWAHLEGNVPGASIGYYFPGQPSLQGLREAREGAWQDVNTGGSTDKLTRNYVSLAFDHGKLPTGGTYAYTLLPGKDAAATAQYAASPDTEILSQTNRVHAVREKKLGLSAFSFWEADQVGAVRANQPASVQVREQGDRLTVTVSDPTRKQSVVTVDLGKAVLKELSKDAGVRVVQTSPYLKLEINTAAAQGKSFTAVFQYDPAQSPSLGSAAAAQ